MQKYTNSNCSNLNLPNSKNSRNIVTHKLYKSYTRKYSNESYKYSRQIKKSNSNQKSREDIFDRVQSNLDRYLENCKVLHSYGGHYNDISFEDVIQNINYDYDQQDGILNGEFNDLMQCLINNQMSYTKTHMFVTDEFKNNLLHSIIHGNINIKVEKLLKSIRDCPVIKESKIIIRKCIQIIDQILIKQIKFSYNDLEYYYPEDALLYDEFELRNVEEIVIIKILEENNYLEQNKKYSLNLINEIIYNDNSFLYKNEEELYCDETIKLFDYKLVVYENNYKIVEHIIKNPLKLEIIEQNFQNSLYESNMVIDFSHHSHIYNYLIQFNLDFKKNNIRT